MSVVDRYLYDAGDHEPARSAGVEGAAGFLAGVAPGVVVRDYGSEPPVRRLSEVVAGAPVDRPVYVFDEAPAGTAFRSPAGRHAGHLVYVRKVVRRTPEAEYRVGVLECARDRQRWSALEYDDPGRDPYRWRPPSGDAF